MIRALRMKGAARRATDLAMSPMTGKILKRYGTREVGKGRHECPQRTIQADPERQSSQLALQAIRQDVDDFGPDVAAPAFGPRMVRTDCGIVGADVRPNWQERPARESITRMQWG